MYQPGDSGFKKSNIDSLATYDAYLLSRETLCTIVRRFNLKISINMGLKFSVARFRLRLGCLQAWSPHSFEENRRGFSTLQCPRKFQQGNSLLQPKQPRFCDQLLLKSIAFSTIFNFQKIQRLFIRRLRKRFLYTKFRYGCHDVTSDRRDWFPNKVCIYSTMGTNWLKESFATS